MKTVTPPLNSKIYLSGAMATANHSDIFSKVEYLLKNNGFHNVFNPSAISYDNAPFAGMTANGFREQISELTQADTVILFGEWKDARGCIAEILTAVLFGCEIYELDYTGTHVAFKPLPINRNNANEYIAHLLLAQQENYLH